MKQGPPGSSFCRRESVCDTVSFGPLQTTRMNFLLEQVGWWWMRPYILQVRDCHVLSKVSRDRS